MKPSAKIVVTLCASLALLLVALVAARTHRVAAAGRPAAASAQKASPGDPTSDADKGVNPASVIRFARNPTPVPPFLVNDLDGNVVSTAALRGKVVVLNFWATWCPPCRDEIPEMVELANRYKDRLVIVGVSMDDDPPSSVKAFAKHAGINYPIIMGSRRITQEYGDVPALPTSFVVDTNGNIVQKHVGLYPEDVYDDEIRALLGMHVDKPIETFEDTGQIFLKNAARATELPGVDFKGLTPDQRHAALKRMNSEKCTCGCNLTIAQCRINDADCTTSQKLAAKIIQEIVAGPKPPPSPTAMNR